MSLNGSSADVSSVENSQLQVDDPAMPSPPRETTIAVADAVSPDATSPLRVLRLPPSPPRESSNSFPAYVRRGPSVDGAPASVSTGTNTHNSDEAEAVLRYLENPMHRNLLERVDSVSGSSLSRRAIRSRESTAQSGTVGRDRGFNESYGEALSDRYPSEALESFMSQSLPHTSALGLRLSAERDISQARERRSFPLDEPSSARVALPRHRRSESHSGDPIENARLEGYFSAQRPHIWHGVPSQQDDEAGGGGRPARNLNRILGTIGLPPSGILSLLDVDVSQSLQRSFALLSSAAARGPTPSHPYVNAPYRNKQVWLLNCRYCDNSLCLRGMKAVLLADTKVELYSTDYPPHGVIMVNDDQLTRNCHCKIRETACLTCGNIAGYLVVQPCSQCLESGNNGHFW